MSNHADSFEGIRAFRPVTEVGWIYAMDRAAVRELGSGALNFEDEVLGKRSVKMLGTGELVVANRAGALEDISSDSLQTTAEAALPGSWTHKSRPRIQQLFVRNFREKQSRVNVLVAALKPRRVLYNESEALRGSVEVEAGRRLSWRPMHHNIKLATIAPDVKVNDDALAYLSRHLPEAVDIKPGKIEPATIDIYNGQQATQKI